MAEPDPPPSPRIRRSKAPSTVLRLAWRGVVARRTRLVLAAAAVALGIGFVAAAATFTRGMSDAYGRLLGVGTGDADLIVRSEAAFGFLAPRLPEEIATEVSAVEGVAEVYPIVQGWARILGTAASDESDDPGPLGLVPSSLGLSFPQPGSALGSIRITSGRPPEDDGEVVIDARSAERGARSIGDRVDIMFLDHREPFEIVGVADVEGGGILAGTTICFFEFDTAQRVLGTGDGFGLLAIASGDAEDPAVVAEHVAAVLPEGVQVVPASVDQRDRLNRVERALGFVDSLLTAIGAAVLLAAAFSIHNTFQILVTERARELAVLRLAGATGSQVAGIVVAEAAVLGVIGAAGGLAAGPGLVSLVSIAADALGVAHPRLAVLPTPGTMLLGLLVGVGVSVAATVPTARLAARTRPLAAVRRAASEARGRRRPQSIVGAASVVAGLALLAAGALTSTGDPLVVAGVGAAAAFLGVSLLMPTISEWLAHRAAALVPAAAGVAAGLAPRSALRRPRRTAAAASALMVGVTLVGMLAVFSSSAKAGIRAAVADEVAADFQIHAGLLAIPSITGVSPDLVDRLRGTPEVGVVSTMRLGVWRSPEGDRNRALLGVDPALSEVLRLDVVAGEFSDLDEDGVMLRADFAAERGLEVGDALAMRFPSGAVRELRVALVHESDSIQIPVAVAMDTFDEHYADRLEYLVLFDAAAGVGSDRARAAAEALVSEYPGTVLTDRDQYSASLARSVDTVLGLLAALVGLAMLVALLGIANTLALSVHERRREIGMLRAVGMTRRQVRRMIRWEAALIGVVGSLVGLVLAVVLGTSLAAAVGRGLRPSVPGGLLVAYLVAAVAGAVAAAAWPASRAAHREVLEAIGTE